MTDDVPSPIDLRLTVDAREWEQTANAKRPSRSEFFARFASEIEVCSPSVQRVLELGSGPGCTGGGTSGYPIIYAVQVL